MKLEGRKISYTVQLKEPEEVKKAVEYFRVNPPSFAIRHMGLKSQRKMVLSSAGRYKKYLQVLDLWTGEIKSKFTVEGCGCEGFDFMR
jgi:hypothetical protein